MQVPVYPLMMVLDTQSVEQLMGYQTQGLWITWVQTGPADDKPTPWQRTNVGKSSDKLTTLFIMIASTVSGNIKPQCVLVLSVWDKPA